MQRAFCLIRLEGEQRGTDPTNVTIGRRISSDPHNVRSGAPSLKVFSLWLVPGLVFLQVMTNPTSSGLI